MSHRMAGVPSLRSPVKARKLRALFPAMLALLLSQVAPAQQSGAGDDEYLQPEQAFQYTLSADEDTLTVEWRG